MKIMFVCLGNICRSPTAHAIARKIAIDMKGQYEISSSGTSAYHIGHKPDARSVTHGNKRGYDFKGIRAQQLTIQDFFTHDYILTMDNQNFEAARSIMPSGSRAKLMPLMAFHPGENITEVPDPYYGGAQGFDLVVDLCEQAIINLFNQLEH
ncbi:low molecular weight protein-tyrosine-phosphatase [Pseudoalteromonas sp. GB56]